MAHSSRDKQNRLKKENRDETIYIPPRQEEQLLISHLANTKADSVLTISHGRGQLAGFLASQNPAANVVCHYQDSHFAQLAEEYWAEADHPPQILCSPDFPEQTCQLVCLPVQKQGNAELTQELLQQAYERLSIGGEFYTAVDNAEDRWLHGQMKTLFATCTRIPMRRGVIYRGVKKAELKKAKDFTAEFSFPWLEKRVTLITRPGVFSHRSLDDGAWALMKSLSVQPGQKVLDLGCGCGAVGIAAALSAPNVAVTAIDSYARAIECTQRNAEVNLEPPQMAKFRTIQTHSSKIGITDKFDLIAANPPYFSQFKIARQFMETAKSHLKDRGQLLVVTKMPEWYSENMPELFASIGVDKIGLYSIVHLAD